VANYRGGLFSTDGERLHKLFVILLTQDVASRVDLRDFCIVSIDPPGCTDIDDALHCRQLENGNLEVSSLQCRDANATTVLSVVWRSHRRCDAFRTSEHGNRSRSTRTGYYGLLDRSSYRHVAGTVEWQSLFTSWW
jgi:hypothetical protein